MEEFVQEFRRVARKSGYEGRLLVKELILLYTEGS